ncbi:hypothetical protein AJ81_08835 [Pseudothermotoga hypogea DSM 11164 = NBRC 106472]|uniref:Glycosyltransferase subfamily 4-like N-terminal domain-containing protein n=1 Tax=Pseudothermotoga hypogea DSM 11164 = NBRC 106472 TaxID=1123384 RepID=A0A0X1KUG8_9THEM|nr:hypothetical protein [Pseudothermotoga hypogea]AJC74883.1 hypothetical protein AJ81_08835 [Pseudothermotoga hypogea DSM 11164 = NBRC 106472]
MKIVIVSPYSPRWNNIASVRWEKFAKYLSVGHSVYFITSCFPSKQSFRSFDLGQTKLVEIPLKYFKYDPHVVVNSKFAKKQTMFSKLLRIIKREIRPVLEKFLPVSSGGMLLHDYQAYVTELSKIISDHERTVLITTYDPWFSLKLGKLFKKRFPKTVVWLADFRDPSFNLHESVLTKLPVFAYATRRILAMADVVLVVSKKMVEDYKRLCGDKVFFLPNGYDGELFLGECSDDTRENFEIAYTGSFHPGTRELSSFILALSRIKEEKRDIYSKLKFIYAGKDYEYVQSLFDKFSMLDILENRGFVSRDEALRLQAQADLLLLIVYTGEDPQEGRSIRTGKVYEYLATGRPILVIAPRDWEMREEIECDGISKVFEKSQTEMMADYIEQLFRKRSPVDRKSREQVIQSYLYESLSKKLEGIIEKITLDESSGKNA